MRAAESTELRLGLVLYGGVSLAVYIYGVVVEVQRLLDASPAYAKALADAGLSKAVVDVIAGTSAGGINGILLAKALSEGADVDAVRDLWLEGGDIGTLLRTLDDPSPGSLLSTEAFERRLQEGFDRLENGAGEPDPAASLDLFVSTTHLRGDRRLFVDALSREVTTLLHRFVVHLKLRGPYGRNDLAAEAGETPESSNRRLVKLARATSAFPVAFDPVLIAKEDRLLGPHVEPSGWFADGGILNNKPFTEALRTIFSRSAEDGPVRRWLLSVDPDPKAIPELTGPGEEPAFDQIATAAVAAIPRYQSIASDLEALEEHNKTVRRVTRTVLDLETGFARTAGGRLGESVEPTYRRLRRRSWADEIAAQLLMAARPDDPADFDPEATQAALAAGASSSIGRREDAGAGDSAGTDPDAAASGPDLAFQRRRTYYLIKLLGMAVVPADGEVEEIAAARSALWKAFEAISQALWSTLASREFSLGGNERTDVAAGARGTHQETFQIGAQYTDEAWDELSDRGRNIAEALRAALAGRSIDLPTGEIDADGAEAIATVDLAEVFDEFAPRDFVLLSIETGGGLRHRDLVNHAQISPESARATGVPAEMKLAGDTAGHFGGFLDEGWRRNDILWGRLDTAEVLIRAILADATEAEQDEAIEAACREVLAAECPAALGTADGDWKSYLSTHAVGTETVAQLERTRTAGLAYRTAVVLRGMLHRARIGADRTAPTGNLRARALRASERFLGRAGLLLLLPRLLLGPVLRRLARTTEPPR